MFEVDKPRRFHYEPRFYDPEKEKWEALKKKYAIERERKESENNSTDQCLSDTNSDSDNPTNATDGEKDLAYFQQRVRTIDREAKQAPGLTWRDFFRKREMPKFNYQPRFSSQPSTPDDSTPSNSSTDSTATDTLLNKYATPKHRIKIHRRFDIADPDYMKPIPGTKIILYTGLVCLLLAIIFLL